MDENKVVVLPDWSPLFWFGAAGVTALGRIFVKDSHWRQLGASKYAKESFLVHESVHLEQQRAGALWFVRYALLRKFRLMQEVEAYGEQAKYDISRGSRSSDAIQRYAACLSSRTYFGMAGREEAVRARTWRARKPSAPAAYNHS